MQILTQGDIQVESVISVLDIQDFRMEIRGNNLTYRIMQYMKVRMAEKLNCSLPCRTEDVLNGMDMDIHIPVCG